MKVELGQLKAFLADSDMVSREKFEETQKEAEERGARVGDLLVNKGLIARDQLIKLKAYILGVPFIDLQDQRMDPEVLKIIPQAIAKKHNIVAFRKSGKDLEVAMLDPQDLRTIDFVKKAAGLKILPRLTDTKSIQKVLRQYEESLEAEFGSLIKEDAEEIKTVSSKEEEDLDKKAKELPVIRIVDSLMKHAVLQRASDVHIEPTKKEVIVRYRIDGILHDAMVLPKQIAPAIVARIKVLADLKLDEHRLPQDGRFKLQGDSYNYSVRVSILPVVEGEKVVMRLLSETAETLSLTEIGLSGWSLDQVERNLKKPIGMILVTGPTGSGKTTTLYSMLEILNSLRVNVSTVEDPVEYQMSRVNQTQVKSEIGFTFSSALRSLLRQDPDVVMVGEIRDNETAALAINAALTGHKVLSTLHTNNAAGAIPRLIDMKVEPFLLSSTLNMILAQRLVRRLRNDKEEYSLDKFQVEKVADYCDVDRALELIKENNVVEGEVSSLEDVSFYRPSVEDDEEGYKGRVGIFEILSITKTIKEMIVKRKSADSIQEQAQKEGMITMIEDGLLKAAQGITSVEEVLRVIVE